MIDQQTDLITNGTFSLATKRNWDRLGVTNSKERCSARANKRLSDKYIVPKESFDLVENIPKVKKLVDDIKSMNCAVDEALFSLGINLLKREDISNENFNYLRSEYKLKNIDKFININLPDESDLLGLVYQFLQTEGKKNIKGSYYTPSKVVKKIVSDIKLKKVDKVFDPCCGSSVYLLNIPNIKPHQIFGVDIDPLAIMISKINYFRKFPKTIEKPKIYQADYLELPNLLNIGKDNFQNDIRENFFDYIITNPPWGGISHVNHSSEILSGEIFSLFLVNAFKQLKENGELRFLLPYSILNVKTHQDIRKYLLDKTNLKEIKLHSGSFSGVMTKYISLKTEKSKIFSKTFIFSENNRKCVIDKKSLTFDNYFIIRATSDLDKQIIKKIFQKKKYDLSNATWALGIVTGDNKGKLFNEQKNGTEPIYTGKEIAPFKLKKVKKHIHYNRANFQQVAKDEIYRAKKKLVYKFISKKLVFSIDTSGHLFLNSANILIPKIPNMSIYSVAAFLNSELYQFLYQKMFGEIKILKSNLIALPFIEITKKQDHELTKKVEKILKSEKEDFADLHRYIYDLFGLSDYQVDYIKGELYGSTNERIKTIYRKNQKQR